MYLLVRRRAQLAVILLVLCIVAACKEDPVKQTAKALNVIARGNKLMAETVIEANRTGLISTSDTGVVLDVVAKIAEADNRANAVLKTVQGQIGQPTQQQLLAIVDSVLTELAKVKALNIPESKARTAIQTSVTSIETTVNSMKLLIAAGGSPQ